MVKIVIVTYQRKRDLARSCRIQKYDQKNNTVFVDADACPVKAEIEKISRQFDYKVILVASYAHHMQPSKDTVTVMVDSRKEEVDLYIVNHCRKGDVVVTQDYGLASLLLPKGVFVLSPRGKEYTEEKMEELLYTRHLSSKQRRAGIKTKGPSKFTQQDVITFCNEFKNILSKKEGI